MIVSSSGGARFGQIVSMTSSPQASSGASSMQLVPLVNKPILEKKAAVYVEVVKNLNDARERGLPFKPATAFKDAYESLGLDASGGKSVHFQKICNW
ncbi:nuclear pore complex protein NUP93A-like [Humulus lupulus]|uniref:nuclear pore complex protein NUP93A-like n=1 Tax=Humulus lupulus TaxID=3486 RepID=UPI002B403AE5|nr:nuclear pore complex protein NUP93A-like [Humulus lupulus]